MEKQTKSEVYAESIRKKGTWTREDIENGRGLGSQIKEGTEYTYIPKPTNKKELFDQFKNLYAQRLCESYQRIFIKNFGHKNIRAIEDELKEINKFIEEAEALSIKDTFGNLYKTIGNSELLNKYEYSRLRHGYYENQKMMEYHDCLNFFHHTSNQVYGKYFLFKEWLEEQQRKLKKHNELIRSKFRYWNVGAFKDENMEKIANDSEKYNDKSNSLAFVICLTDLPLQEYPSFLSKQLDQYEGDRANFLEFTKLTIRGLKNLILKKCNNNDEPYKVALDWVENKSKELNMAAKSDETSKPKLSLREIALLCYFDEIVITEHNQNDYAREYKQENKSGNLYSRHYKPIVDDEIGIYQHKNARKNLTNIKPHLQHNPKALKKIEQYLKKC